MENFFDDGLKALGLNEKGFNKLTEKEKETLILNFYIDRNKEAIK